MQNSTKLKTKLNKFKENWYFIRQDIVSYLIPTTIFISLCLVKDFSYQRALYGIFECLVFYIPFWVIRICFSDTYHSDSWKKCKMWTRIMLCTGVFIVWLFPVEYSLCGSLGVAFICCLILYFVALESKDKKKLKKQNENLQNEINALLQKIKHKDIWAMNETELYEHCRNCGLSEDDCKIAYLIVIERLKGQELYNTIRYSESQSKRKRKQILNKIIK